MRINLAAFLALCAAGLLFAERVVVPARGVYGQCSSGKLKQVSYDVRVDSPIAGIYLLPKTEYDKLVAASNSVGNSTVKFNYYIDYSCTGGSVTSCSKFSGSKSLRDEAACVALVNENTSTTNADFTVKFDDAADQDSSTNDGNGKISAVTIIVVVICGAFFAILCGIFGWRKCRKSQQPQHQPQQQHNAFKPMQVAPPPSTMVSPPHCIVQEAPQVMPVAMPVASQVMPVAPQTMPVAPQAMPVAPQAMPVPMSMPMPNYNNFPQNSYMNNNNAVYGPTIANVQPLHGNFYSVQGPYAAQNSVPSNVGISPGNSESPLTQDVTSGLIDPQNTPNITIQPSSGNDFRRQ